MRCRTAVGHYVQLLWYHHPGHLTSCLRTACLVDWCWMQTFTITKSNKGLCGTSIHHQTLSPAVAAAFCVTWACQHAHRLHFMDILGIYTFRVELWNKFNPQADVRILPLLLVFNMNENEWKNWTILGRNHLISWRYADCFWTRIWYLPISQSDIQTIKYPSNTSKATDKCKAENFGRNCELQEFYDKQRSSRSRSIDFTSVRMDSYRKNPMDPFVMWRS